MLNRQARFWILITLILCGCGHNRHALYQRLPERDKELYDRSRQFMTERQQERFLVLDDSDKRARFVEDLHIPDRLAKFPEYIRDAILAQKIIPGMSKEAVLLAWGKPREIDRRDVDGIPSACWMYDRVGSDGQLSERNVYFLNDLVTEVTP